MRVIGTLFWTFLLMQMLGYVGSAMTDTVYSIKDMSILSVVVTILLVVISAVIPNQPSEEV